MKKGFTLVELILVIAIIAIVTAIVLPNYRSGNRRLALERSVHQLHHDIRRAQEMSMSAKEVGGTVPPGFGVYFNTASSDSSYVIYADDNGNEYYDGGDVDISEIDLEGGIIISSIELASGGYNSGGINFRSPDPTINIYHSALDQESWILITLESSIDPSLTGGVRVYKSGLIHVVY